MDVPFMVTALDCAGPFLTKQGRGKVRPKRYLLLFTCTKYRAVHLEMLYQMDTPSFLLAFSRFLARRNRPKLVISDNGTNFVRGEKEMKALWKQSVQPDWIKDRYPEIAWKFNTPAAPHTGGVFERLIRSVKVSLLAVTGPMDLTDEELHTAFAIVEGAMNNRPLSRGPDTIGEDMPITPNHFLGKWGPVVAPDIGVVPTDRYYAQRWHRLQTMMDQFWSRFVREAGVRLQAFPKWTKHRLNLEKDQIVIVLEEKLRGFWPLGKILEVYPGQDGVVRSVLVKFRNGTYRRPAHRIIPLNLD